MHEETDNKIRDTKDLISSIFQYKDSPITIDHQDNICSPIHNLAEIWGYLSNPPSWIKDIVEICPRSSTVVANNKTLCHYIEGSTNTFPKRLDRDLVPRTLVCHDMRNGYLEDKFLDSVNHGNGYTFYRWAQIDIFVYFSHHFITIPPLSWINLAHNNGVKILGTFITEWDDGNKICKEFLKDYETMQVFVDALAEITVLYKLDGWLLNIENKIENTSILIEFVKCLTETLHAVRPGSLVIWYDSVIIDGALKWQNELNSKNRFFFDVCDGIFINYTWTVNNILTTSKFAQHRNLDVFVGIDVFGRNTYGGGKFNCHVAAKQIRDLNMSMAIFAQGWTHETLDKEPEDTFFERFLHKDNSFWRSLWPYLYTHPVNTLFDTLFYIGADKETYKLNKQETQLSRFLHSSELSIEDSNLPILKNQCNCQQLRVYDKNTACLLTKKSEKLVYIHNLFICDIMVDKDVILYTFTKRTSDEEKRASLTIILLVQENGAFRKVICNSLERAKAVNNNFTISNVYPLLDKRVLRYDPKEIPENTEIRCYHIIFKNPTRILEISGEIENGNSIILHGIGLKNANIM